jgi:hypothetical protein
MAVYQTGGGGSMLGSVLGLGAMLIPGLQPFAPFLSAAGALMNGNPAGALASAAGGLMGSANAPKINEDSLTNALLNGARSSYMPEGETIWDQYRDQVRAPIPQSGSMTGQAAANNLIPQYKIDPTDSIAREQDGYVYDAWKDYGRRRRV